MEQILALISAECSNMTTEANNRFVLSLLYAHMYGGRIAIILFCCRKCVIILSRVIKTYSVERPLEKNGVKTSGFT